MPHIPTTEPCRDCKTTKGVYKCDSCGYTSCLDCAALEGPCCEADDYFTRSEPQG